MPDRSRWHTTKGGSIPERALRGDLNASRLGHQWSVVMTASLPLLLHTEPLISVAGELTARRVGLESVETSNGAARRVVLGAERRST